MNFINSTGGYSFVSTPNVPLAGGQQSYGNDLYSLDSVKITTGSAPENHSKKKHRNREKLEEIPVQPEVSSRSRKSAPSKPTEADGWNILSMKTNEVGALEWSAHKDITKEAQAVFQRFSDLNALCTWGTLSSNNSFNVGVAISEPLMQQEVESAIKRGKALASDPAKGGKITPGSIEEAAVALMAEKCGVIAAPAVREETGSAEIVDGEGKSWDVKSPLSPPPDAKWVFDVDHQVVKVRHDLSQGDRVLLNLSKCNNEDTEKVIETMERELTADEKPLIAVLVNREALKN